MFSRFFEAWAATQRWLVLVLVLLWVWVWVGALVGQGLLQSAPLGSKFIDVKRC